MRAWQRMRLLPAILVCAYSTSSDDADEVQT